VHVCVRVHVCVYVCVCVCVCVCVVVCVDKGVSQVNSLANLKDFRGY